MNAENILLVDLLEEYLADCEAKGQTIKTLKNKRQEIFQFLRFLEEKRATTKLSQLDIYSMKAYRTHKDKKGLQPQSIVSMWKMIRAWNSWLVEEGYMEENIARKVKLPKVPTKIMKGFNDKDIINMIDAFSYDSYLEARNKAIIAMFADTGIRSIELRRLKESDVNIKEGKIIVYGKGNKERLVFISPALKKILIRYNRLRSDYIKDKINLPDIYFLSYKKREISHVALDNIIKEAGKRANVEGKRVSPHTFRHYYSVKALLQGMDIYHLSRLLGHTEIQTTQRYLKTLEDEGLLDKAISTSPLMNI